jgi:hypothetical protein
MLKSFYLFQLFFRDFQPYFAKTKIIKAYTKYGSSLRSVASKLMVAFCTAIFTLYTKFARLPPKNLLDFLHQNIYFHKY